MGRWHGKRAFYVKYQPSEPKLSPLRVSLCLEPGSRCLRHRSGPGVRGCHGRAIGAQVVVVLRRLGAEEYLLHEGENRRTKYEMIRDVPVDSSSFVDQKQKIDRNSQATHITMSAASHRHSDLIAGSKPVIYHFGGWVDHHSPVHKNQTSASHALLNKSRSQTHVALELVN